MMLLFGILLALTGSAAIAYTAYRTRARGYFPASIGRWRLQPGTAVTVGYLLHVLEAVMIAAGVIAVASAFTHITSGLVGVAIVGSLAWLFLLVASSAALGSRRRAAIIESRLRETAGGNAPGAQ